MKLLPVLLLISTPLLATVWAGEPHNQLTAEEKAAGWKLLFDGKTTQGWRGFKKDKFPEKGWAIEDGILKKIAKERGGDIITLERFSDFDLVWDWKIPARANSGLKYFILEERGEAIGHEYQLIDDSLVKHGKGSTASFYDVLPPKQEKGTKPPGEWNRSRILVEGNKVRHWLNGVLAIEYELGSEEVRNGVANSKFRSVPDFGTKVKGHILLTDHTDEAWFRNIKIKNLEP